VKFHNGEEFDADSVVYTLNFVADPANKAVTQQNVQWIQKVEKLGKYKVRVISKEPFPAAKDYLATTLAIHPAKYYKEAGPKGMNAKPVGSGPYKVVDYQPGKSITLEKFADYFKDSPRSQPKIGKVRIRFIPDRQTQMAEVLSGGEDFIMHVPKDQAEKLQAMPNLQVLSGNTMRIVFMQMNSQDGGPAPELKDIRVRKAIAHAIDREAIIKNIVGGGAEIINTICTPSQVGCTQEGATVYKYDPALSKKLLAEAGYPNGFSLDIHAYRERNQTEAIINYLQAVGIKAKLNFLQYAAMRDLVRANKTALVHQTWGSNLVNDVSASTPVYYAFGSDDVTRNAQVKELLDKGDHTIDPKARNEVYRKALALISENAYSVPLWSLPVYYVASKEVNFKPYSDELVRFWEMSWK
jgi:peptide/nickel transport system substrate-binding protein